MLFCILILLLMGPSKISAEVYKWVDQNGKIHYSDTPHDAQSKPINIPKPPNQSSVSEALERSSAIKNLKNKINQIEQDKVKKQHARSQKDIQAKNKLRRLCHSARKDIIALGHGRPIYFKEKGRKDYFLSDQEKNNKITELRQFINKNCQN